MLIAFPSICLISMVSSLYFHASLCYKYNLRKGLGKSKKNRLSIFDSNACPNPFGAFVLSQQHFLDETGSSSISIDGILSKPTSSAGLVETVFIPSQSAFISNCPLSSRL